jgi:hypothetical protein
VLRNEAPNQAVSREAVAVPAKPRSLNATISWPSLLWYALPAFILLRAPVLTRPQKLNSLCGLFPPSRGSAASYLLQDHYDSMPPRLHHHLFRLHLPHPVGCAGSRFPNKKQFLILGITIVINLLRAGAGDRPRRDPQRARTSNWIRQGQGNRSVQ